MKRCAVLAGCTGTVRTMSYTCQLSLTDTQQWLIQRLDDLQVLSVLQAVSYLAGTLPKSRTSMGM